MKNLGTPIDRSSILFESKVSAKMNFQTAHNRVCLFCHNKKVACSNRAGPPLLLFLEYLFYKILFTGFHIFLKRQERIRIIVHNPNPLATP